MSDNKIHGKRPKTDITNDILQSLLYDYANLVPKCQLIRKYKLGDVRLNNIIERQKDKIEALRLEIANSLDSRTKALITQRRHQILESISENDINNAKLKDKTSSVVDLTNVKRLESGQSTENVAININGMSQEQMIEFIKTGKTDDKNVNTNETLT